MTVGRTLEAGIETDVGNRKMKLGRRCREKRLSRMQDGSGLASSCVVAL